MEDLVSRLCEVTSNLDCLDYRITGLTAVNLYGFGISTNVLDIAVESDSAVEVACHKIDLKYDGGSNPFVYEGDNYYIRIQGDILGEPYIHPLGFKLHSKDLLIRRLEIYSSYDPCILKACAWVALTKDSETTARYKYYWNRL